MNINPNRMSTLTELFSDLDDEYQGKLLYMAYKYKVEQQVKKELREKTNRMPGSKEVEDAVRQRMADLARFMKNFEALDETGKAAIVYALEKLVPTSMRTEEKITVTTEHHPVNLDQSLQNAFPDADLNASKRAVSECIK